MSGPIIRSGPSQQFTQNWDGIFGKSAAKKTAEAKKPAKKTSAKSAKKKPAKKGKK